MAPRPFSTILERHHAPENRCTITIVAGIDVDHEMFLLHAPETQRCRIPVIFGILRLTLVYQKAHGVSAPREEPSYEQNFTRPA